MGLTGRVVSVSLAAILLAAPASAQIDNPSASTPTTLYYHIFDTFNTFVINTQPMDVSFFEVGGTSFPTVSGTPANEAMGAQWDFNTIYGTSTAGPVEYGFIENGKPRFHHERGIAADVEIDTSVQPVSYLYIDVRDVTGQDEVSNILPELTVRFTMRTGDSPGTDADYDSGNLIMHGQKTATVCADGESDPAPAEQLCSDVVANASEVLVPDAEGIVEFAVPLELEMGTIPKGDAFNMRIDWWQEEPSGQVCGEDQCAEGYMRLAADQDHLPRLEMNIVNPVYIEFIHPQVAAGTLLIHTGANSPWGTYDLDTTNISVSVEGPTDPGTLERVVAQNQHVHGLHDQAAEITYLWRFREADAEKGEYTIKLEVPNQAGTATATGQAGFTIDGKKAYGVDDTGEVVPESDQETSSDKSSPGPGALIVIPLAVALLRRRSP